jgi:hypothetical protein
VKKKTLLAILNELRCYLTCDSSKPLSMQAGELLALLRTYRFLPYQYLIHRLYEQDVIEGVLDYMPPVLLKRYRAQVNPAEAQEKTLNKLLFAEIMRQHGLPVVQILAVIHRDKTITDLEGRPIPLGEFPGRLRRWGLSRIFVKPTHGCEGSGARILTLRGNDLYLGEEKLTDDLMIARLFSGSEYERFLVQPVVEQHPLLVAMNSASVNTLRIDTLIDESGSVQSSGAFLRVGSGKAVVDNVARGGYAIKVDVDSGRLGRYGTTHARHGRRVVEQHPDTGFRFEGVELPHWEQVQPLLTSGTRALAPLKYVGWDLAFQEQGILLMEASAVHDLFVFQTATGGLRNTPMGRAALAGR